MDARKEAKLNMFRVIKQICEDNTIIVSTNPAFLATYNIYKAKLSTLIGTVTSELQVITGIAADKTTLKKNLSQSAADICALIFAYASSISNNTMRDAVSFTYTDLFKIKDDKIHETCQNIYNLANTNAAALVPYGISPTMLSAFQQSITDYANIVPKPKSAKAQRAAYTKSINTQTKEIDKLLTEQLDNLITVFKVSKPDFVNTFRSGRVVIDPNSTVTQLKGKIIDSLTKLPLQGALIEITGAKNYTCKTNKLGFFTQKPIDQGEYTLTITLDGYQTITITTYKAKLGQINKQIIQLVAQ